MANCLVVGQAFALEFTPSAVLSLKTEPIYRGISESENNQAAALNVDLPLSENWMAGIGASSVLTGGDNQRDRSITSYFSYNNEINNTLVVGASLLHRAFPGSIKEWDYTELQTSVRWNDAVSVTLAYADNYYHHDTATITAGIDWFKPISARRYWSASLGTTKFDNAIISEYVYANLGVGWRKGPMTAEISYGYTTRHDVVLFGYVIESPELQLNLTYFAW